MPATFSITCYGKTKTYKENQCMKKTKEQKKPCFVVTTVKPNINLSLGDVIKSGEERVFFYRVKLTTGQLHSISKIENDYSLN